MKEYNNEIKARVFAPYIGKQLIDIDGDTHTLLSVGIDEFQLISHQNDFGRCRVDDNDLKLILKPLSAISDEDAIEVIKMFGCLKTEKSGFVTEFSPIGKIKAAIKEAVYFPHHIYQYLQSRGYDLPNYLLDNQTLNQVGWAVYENE